ncbi:hypothetical protein [Dysgonomonas sp. 25]|uniref:hypothetical protein n=1 Tax=Dysgonomonas sp. 25 TaxID=2302933 RepID=UPI0013D81C4E|nr:hypothetical protein [Dysgonomonas sp. 25]NDV68010.1 hypothetical protein [Dysgonomonas sp. 25]
MNTKVILPLLVATFILVFTSCVENLGPGWGYLVDNPLDKDIVINIDDKDYTIPADSSRTIKLSKGKHTLTYDGSSVNFVTKVSGNKSVTIMNPTLSNYMLHAYIYVKKNYNIKGTDDIYAENSHEYKSDVGAVMLPVKVVNSLFIEKNHHQWSFGLNQEAKTEVGTSYPGRYHVFHKIYREEDYRNAFAEELPPGIVFPANAKKLNELPPYKFPVEEMMSDCEVANNYMKEMAEKWNETIATSTDILQSEARFNQQFHFKIRGEMIEGCSTDYNPNRDETSFNAAMDRLNEELRYISDASSYIVE